MDTLEVLQVLVDAGASHVEHCILEECDLCAALYEGAAILHVPEDQTYPHEKWFAEGTRVAVQLAGSAFYDGHGTVGERISEQGLTRYMVVMDDGTVIQPEQSRMFHIEQERE